jgi:glycosyltransferase involved in cell wall biosynthesis
VAETQPLRVAHVHWAFPPTTGGVESHLFDLARLQTAAGHTVTVVTGEPEPIRTGAYEVVSTPLLQLDSIRDSEVDETYADNLRMSFTSILGDRRIDVVHSHDLHHFTPEPALVLTELRERLRFSLHHSFHETWPDVLADRPVYKTWDGNYAVSTFVQRGCERRIGFKPLLFPLAVDTDVFRTTRRALSDGGAPILLHPARLLPWKGVHFTIEMLALLKARGVLPRLLLTDTQRIADWDRELELYREEICGLIETHGLADQVEFVHASFSDMPTLYERADIVLYPTVADEPFGLVPLEAMSSERPIVASRCGGIAETVVDGVTGFTIEPGDVEALADRVEQLLRDPAEARAIAAAGRRHVLASFDIRDYVETLHRRYALSLLRG